MQGKSCAAALLFIERSPLGSAEYHPAPRPGQASAIRMFLKRSVVVNGVPFSMTLPKQEYRAERAIRAVQSLSEAAQQNGTADMSLDEINAEIAASRA